MIFKNEHSLRKSGKKLRLAGGRAKMGTRRIFFITVMLLVGNTLNVYANSFIQEESEISLSDIEDAGTYTENLAYVFWDDEEGNWKGYLDETGKVKFYMPVDGETDQFDSKFDNGYTWFEYQEKFYVIDTDGNIRSEYDAENVFCYGAGYTWIETEDSGSWEDSGKIYYTLYDPNGKEIVERSIDKIDEWGEEYGYSFSCEYLGDAAFVYMDTQEEKCRIFDAKTSNIMEIKEEFGKIADYGSHENIIATLVRSEDSQFCNLVLICDGNEQIIQVPEQYNGEYELPTLLGWSDEYVLLTLYNDDNREQPALIYNIKNQSFKMYEGKYKKYLVNYSNASSAIYKNILVLRMEGADEKGYVCLINADTLKEIGEPIEADDFVLKNKVLLVKKEDEYEEKTELYDVRGRLVLALDENETIKDIGKNVLIIETEDDYEETYKFIRFDGTSMFNAIDISQAKKLMDPEE